MRTLNDRRLIAVVPRLMNHGLPAGQQIPIGRDAWKDTRIVLPADSTTSIYRHAFSGARMKVDDAKSLLAGDLFRTIPVALLVSED
jgi:maltooligosyltrehalose synthase